MIKVLQVRGIAQLQDFGRFGFRQYGISTAGAMDKTALKTANLLLGNQEDAVGIELAMASLSVQFECDCVFVITGAFYQANLAQKPIYSYSRYNARKGQILTLERPTIGIYGYFCVAGGFNARSQLGSFSTDSRYGLGGLNGRLLQAQDRLTIADPNYSTAMREISILPPPMHWKIRTITSTEYEAFTPDARQDFWQHKWLLQSNSNRMGYRLKGKSLALKAPLEMRSHAVQFGTIQVPPNGQPIVLMADCQTTGGYPKIATVIEADLNHLAQIRFGSEIQFQQVNIEQALQAQKTKDSYFYQIQRIFNEQQHL